VSETNPGSLRLRFLGTGTSYGVPVLGCDCAICASTDPRDQRSRHAALIEGASGRLLIDTPPELRAQLLAAGTDRVDAVWYTHMHADHVHGIDDLRAFTSLWNHPVALYAPQGTRAQFHARFPYIFDETVRAVQGTSKPALRVTEVDPDIPVELLGHQVVPLPVPHGPLTVYGLRIGALGYVTDAKRLPPGVLDALQGVEVLVLNALWFGHPHPTHFNVEEAVEAARTVGAARTYLTHLTHRVAHEELEARLPEGVFAAYDGLVVDIPASDLGPPRLTG